MIRIKQNQHVGEILIAGDLAYNLKLLADILSEANCRVQLVPDGKSAIRHIEKQKPDLLLLALKIDGEDSLALCRILKNKQTTWNIPIIFIADIEDASSKMKVFEAGAVDLITQPFVPEEVIGRVKLHLSISALQNELKIQNENLKEEIERRKRAEEELIIQKEQLKVTLLSIGEAVITTDIKGTIQLINSEAERLTGWQASDAVGLKYTAVFSIYNEMTNERQIDPVVKVIESGENVQLANHTKLVSKTGHEYYISDCCSAIRNEDNEIIGAVLIFSDETEKKINQIKLRESEEKFRNFFENSTDGISLTHFDGHIEANKAFCSMTGYSEKELANICWRTITHPDDIELQEKVFSQLKNGQQGSIRFTKRFITKSDEILWANVNTTLQRDDSGNPLHFLSSISNITELKNSLETIKKLKLAIDSSSDAFFITNIDGNIEYINPAFQKIYGYTEEEALGKTPRILKSGQMSAEAYTHFWSELLAKRSVIGEIINKSKDGKLVNVHAINYPILSADGHIVGFISINRDITEEKQIKENLEEIKHLLNAFIEANTDMMFVKDSQFRYLIVNEAMAEFFDKTPEVLIGKTDAELADADKIYPCKSSDERALRSSFSFKTIEKLGDKIYETTKFPIALSETKKGIGGIIRDVTEREQFRIALEKSEIKYRHLFEQNPQALWIYDLQSLRFIEVNEACCARYGYGKDEFNGLLINDLHSEDELWVVSSRLQSNQPDAYTGIWKHQKKNHEVIYVDCLAHEIELNHRKAVMVLSYDITKRRKAEIELQKISQTVVQSPASIVITNTGGIIEYVNPRFEQLTGYSKEQAIGKNPNILKTGHTTPDEYKQMWKQLKGGAEWKGEFLNRKKNGELYWELATISPVKDNYGNIQNFVAIKENITERKRNDQVKNILLEISNASIISHDMESFLGIVKAQLGQIIDTTHFYVALYHAEDDSFSIPYFNDAMDSITQFSGGKSLTAYIIRTGKPLLANRSDLDKLIEEGKIEPLRKRARTWLGVPLMLKDKVFGVFALQNYEQDNAYDKEDLRIMQLVSYQISISLERKQAEEELKVAYEKATESDRLKSSFMATMSHELRTPLNAVIGFSELIDQNLPIDVILEFSKTINKSGIHLLQIVEDIFDITFIESGELKLYWSKASLSEIREKIDGMVLNEQSQLRKNNLLIHTAWPLEYLTLNIDQKRLLQILMNLIKNALKFTESGFIKYGCKPFDADGQTYIQFFVEDSGPGIEPEKQKQIFDVFRQADESFSKRHGGVGIGLSIAKELTEMMNGKLELESELGSGSIFSVTFPVVNG